LRLGSGRRAPGTVDKHHPEAPMPDAALHLTIHGRVHGVGFRVAMCDAAASCGVTGWVRNRHDGTVEAVACGPTESVERLRRWAQRGPPSAQVASVAVRAPDTAELAAVGAHFACLPTC
jgi:acylphosphatase